MLSDKIDYLVSCEEILRAALDHKMSCSARLSNSIKKLVGYNERGNPETLEDVEREVIEAEKNYRSAEKTFSNILESWENAFNSVHGEAAKCFNNYWWIKIPK